jgi:hypothetical protein
MTEAEWLACKDPGPMLQFLERSRHDPGLLTALFAYLRGQRGDRQNIILVSDRKLRLFACACCRQIWSALTDEHSRRAVETAERAAERIAKRGELTKARAAAREAAQRLTGVPGAAAAWQTTWKALPAAVRTASKAAARQAARATADRGAFAAARRQQADLLRDIVGNPFRTFAVPMEWPPTVLELAQSLYAGADCAFALHDALLETGHTEFAEHFLGREHPKGCWVLDLILGKR